jgi:hypothetical protein
LTISEIDNQQAVGAAVREKTQHPGFIGECRTVNPAWPSSEHWVRAPQRKEVTMQRINRSVPLSFAEIEHRSEERVDVAGISQLGLHLARRETGKLSEEAATPFADIARQLDLVVGKIKERARRGEFLPLEQHRNARHQQEISGHCAKAARTRQRVTALSGAGIGDLVVVLQKDDKAFRREIERRRAARFLLPLVALPLIEEAVFGGSDELARAAAVIRVVGFVMSG